MIFDPDLLSSGRFLDNNLQFFKVIISNVLGSM